LPQCVMAPKGKTKAKAGAKGKAKAKGRASPEPERLSVRERKTEKDLAIDTVVAAARCFSASCLLGILSQERKAKEAELAEAMRAAEKASLRMEMRKAEAARAKEAAKRAKAKKIAEDTKKLLTSAFDGEVTELGRILDSKSGITVQAKDANGITALSEAASGGSAEAVKFLISRRSDPNSRGEFQRTPLWRACYAGHASIIELLLESGCDPRLFDDQGQTPIDVSSKDEISNCLRAWDVQRTDELVEEWESWFEDTRLEEDFRQKEAMRSVNAEFDQALAAHEAAQETLARAKAAMRNREKEHGIGLAAGQAEARMACESADAELQKADQAAIAAQGRFDKANVARLAALEECGASPDALPGREVDVKDLNNVLIRDVGERIGKSSKWPLLIDPSDCGRKLLLYAGCSVASFWRPEDMDPKRLRIALLSMLRAGGILAVDLALFGVGVDRSLLASPFEQVRPWLFEELVARSAEGRSRLLEVQASTKRARFHELVEKDEKKNFGLEHFDDERISKFKFVVVTATERPHKELLSMFDIVRVVANE